MSATAPPRRRAQLYTSTVHDRFVVLDPVAQTLVELHTDVRSLWPLLDGSHSRREVARGWPLTADLAGTEARRITDAVLDELTAANLLERDD